MTFLAAIAPDRGAEPAAPSAVPRVDVLGGWLLRAALAGLTVFHGALLWERIASLSLLEPGIALRWGAALLLLASLVLLRRAGGSLVRGREAMIIWILVALLHAGMTPAAGVWAMPAAADAGLWLALPVALSTVLVWASGTAGAVAPVSPRRPLGTGPPRRSLLRAAYLEILSARPPPDL